MRIFSPDFFSSFFVGKSAQKNPPGKSPAKSAKIYTTKILQHISADCPGQLFTPRAFFLKLGWSPPKGPFRTKNSTAHESVVFCYRRSFLLSVPFSCLFCLEKQALLSTLSSVLLLPYRIFLAVVNLLSVLFLVRKGPLGRLLNYTIMNEDMPSVVEARSVLTASDAELVQALLSARGLLAPSSTEEHRCCSSRQL